MEQFYFERPVLLRITEGMRVTPVHERFIGVWCMPFLIDTPISITIHVTRETEWQVSAHPQGGTNIYRAHNDEELFDKLWALALKESAILLTRVTTDGGEPNSI